MLSADEALSASDDYLKKIDQSKPKFGSSRHPLYSTGNLSTSGSSSPRPPPSSKAMDWIPTDALSTSTPSSYQYQRQPSGSGGGSAAGSSRRSVSASKVRESSSRNASPRFGNIEDATANNTRFNGSASLNNPSSLTASQSLYETQGERRSSDPASGNYSDRKIDLLSKRFKHLLDYMKNIEKENKSYQERVNDLTIQQQKLLDSQTNDKKVITSLKETTNSLKLKIDLLMNSEEIKEKLNHQYGNPPGSASSSSSLAATAGMIDSSHLDQLINSKINHSLMNTIEEMVMKQEKLNSFRNSTSREAKETSMNNRYFIDQITLLEKEVLKQKNDISSLKSKQSYLDSIYTEIQSTSSVKELEMIENHKKQLKSYRLEFNSLVTNMNEQIEKKLSLENTNTLEIQEMKENYENSISKIGNLLSTFDIKMNEIELSLLSTHNSLTLLSSNHLKPIESKQQELESSISYLSTECSLLFTLKDEIKEIKTNQVSFQNSLILHSSELMQMTEMCKTINSTISLLQKEILSIQEKSEEKMNVLSSEIQNHTKQTNSSLEILSKSQKKLKIKVNEIITNLSSLNEMKEKIELLIKELEKKMLEEMSQTYHLQTTFQKNTNIIQYLNEKSILLEEKMENAEKKNVLSYEMMMKGNKETFEKLQEKLFLQLQESQKEKNDFISSFTTTYQQFYQDFEKVKKGKLFVYLFVCLF
jgi:chromosome segregation ATPase